MLLCEGRSSLSAVEGKRTEKAELHISAAELRSHLDKLAEEKLQKRCVKTHVKRPQFNQEGTLNYGARFVIRLYLFQSLSLATSDLFHHFHSEKGQVFTRAKSIFSFRVWFSFSPWI